jgi:hypothetical protein
LAEKRRFQIQLSRFWTKNDDFKSDFGVFAGRTAISSPTFPFLDAGTEILNPTFFVLCWKNYFFWLNRSYSPETDFTKIINGNCGF